MTWTSWGVLVLGAQGLLVGCAPKADDDSSAGQTGSLVVAPDYETPVQFRRIPPPGTVGSTPPFRHPRRLLEAPTRLASLANGSRQAVATPQGLGIFSVLSGDGLPEAESLIEGLLPQWVEAAESQLLTIASGSKTDSEQEDGLQTRFYSFELPQLQRPQILELPGRFIQAKRLDDRVMILTEEAAVTLCRPGSGPQAGAPAAAMIVTELRREAGAWSVEQSIRVEAQGYVETSSAYVLTTGSPFGQVESLTVVELGRSGLTKWPEVDLSAETQLAVYALARAPMAFANGKLAILLSQDPLMELRVVPLDAAGDTSSSLFFQGSEAELGQSDFATRTFFQGEMAVLPGTEVNDAEPMRTSEDNSQNAHAVVRWSAADGAIVVAQLPEDVESVLPMGKRLLALSPQRSIVLSLGDEGISQQELDASPVEAGLHFYQLHFDADRQQALLPYLRQTNGSELPTYAVAVLTGLDGQPGWSSGTALGGEPWRLSENWPSQWSSVRAVGDDEWWLLDRTGDYSVPRTSNWQLESFSAGDATSLPIGFRERALDARLTGTGPVTLSVNGQGQRLLRLGGAEEAAIALQYAEARLALAGEEAIAYQLRSLNACVLDEPNDVDGEAMQCLDTDRAALALIELRAPASLTQELLLPELPPPGQVGRVSYEWAELIVQNETLALLQHRGINCRSVADCQALGIEYEVDEIGGGMPMCETGDEQCASQVLEPQRRISGYRKERWLYPFDLETGQFTSPLLLGDADSISAAAMIVEGTGLALLQQYFANSGEFVPGAVRKARYELLQWSQSVPTGESKRTTVPGTILWVNASNAISLEPSQVPTGNGGSVGSTLHYLSLQADGAHIEQTLELAKGHTGHLWAERNGYLLLTPDDRCETREVQLIALGLRDGQLEQLSSLVIAGTRWRLLEATDELVRLTRSVGELEQHALISVNDGTLTLQSIESAISGTPIALHTEDFHLARAIP